MKNQSHVKAATLAVMCFALFLSSLDETVVNLALPKIQSSLGSGISGLQWVINAYTLSGTSLVLPSGTLGDIYGRKRVFLVGLVIFTVASTICGLAPSLGVLIAGRILQGIGSAALVPGSLSILTDTFPEPKEKTKAIGIWSGVSGIALVAGPLLGGLLVDNLGWQSVFFLNIPLGAIAFWAISRVVKESKNPNQQRLDVPGVVLSIILLASLTYAVTEAKFGIWRSPLVVFLLAVAIFSLLAFLVVESHSSHPMLPPQLFKNPTFAVVNVVRVLVFFTVVSLLFIFSLFLQQVQGYSAVATGLRFLPMNIAFIVASLVSGWFAVRLGWRYTIATGLIIASIATLLLIQTSVDTEFRVLLWSLVFSGFGCGLTLAPLTAAGISSAPTKKAGIASAVLGISNRFGSVLGIALQGTIFTQLFASDLARSLSAWGIPSHLHEQIITNALHGGAKVSSDLPSGYVLHQAIGNAFVSGLHTVVLVASFALLAGALLILVFVRSNFNQISKNSLISINSRTK
ncbi:MFS transporter [Chlorogloeopsis sp. ULAP01]|uniref:MFS transporter n=1 Tax=Chlorogloeopsis sp. ULAP01 TaxID=3056483 RepID=UPI0025AA8FA7|nr:MFS transporter [Chlorogloeopsis sp. ULAP01]MDM9383454.1 MFS transporter [Chlorogloeopsis sp. ULAP01]